MAGIGWRLERLIGLGTLSGAVAAYATGAAVMALPWALTTAVLVALPILLGRNTAGYDAAETVVTIAYSVALLVDGPFQVAIARHTADRLYEGSFHAIAGPLCRGLALVSLLGACAAACTLLLLGLPAASVLSGGALAASAAAQWTALSVGNGLCSPARVLGSVGAGAAAGLTLAPVGLALFGHGVPGYLFALVTGQGLTLAFLSSGILKALPEGNDEGAALLPAFREYAFLAAAGFAFNASLWVDKILTRLLAPPEAREIHASVSTLAWLSTIPCLAWIFVEVETTFHRRFRAFFAMLEGGAPLADLRYGVRGLERECLRLLRGAVEVQAGVTLFMQAAAGACLAWLDLPASALLPFRLLLLGAGLQALALLALILLYYFDLRRDAFFAAAGLFAAVAIGTTAASCAGFPPGGGMALGLAAGTAHAWLRVRRGVRAVLHRTLLGQPFGAERLEMVPGDPRVEVPIDRTMVPGLTDQRSGQLTPTTRAL
jgi:uncharacterized membrane protein